MDKNNKIIKKIENFIGTTFGKIIIFCILMHIYLHFGKFVLVVGLIICIYFVIKKRNKKLTSARNTIEKHADIDTNLTEINPEDTFALEEYVKYVSNFDEKYKNANSFTSFSSVHTPNIEGSHAIIYEFLNGKKDPSTIWITNKKDNYTYDYLDTQDNTTVMIDKSYPKINTRNLLIKSVFINESINSYAYFLNKKYPMARIYKIYITSEYDNEKAHKKEEIERLITHEDDKTDIFGNPINERQFNSVHKAFCQNLLYEANR